MSAQNINAKIKHRLDTSANWTSANPVLLAGELGIESDSTKFKFGDGVTAWNDLNYAITHLSGSGWIYNLGDGSDGEFAPSGNVTISGDKNYTSVNIPLGVTVTVNPWATIKCQGAFNVAGTLTSTCKAGGLGGGYNGYNKGSSGSSGKYAGTGGAGGNMVGGTGGAGGGSVSTDDYGLNLKSDAGILYRVPLGLRGVGGSGGGGGKDQGYVGARGGAGGKGGGSIVIVTGAVTVSGSINSDGGNGLPEQAWPGAPGGGGGGGEVLVIASSCDNPSKITANFGTGYVNGTAGFVSIHYRTL